MQIRSVECIDTHGAHNTQCDPATRPESVQSCSTGISCTSEAPTTEFNELISSENPNESNLEETLSRVDDDVTEEENDGLVESSKAMNKPKLSADIDDEPEEDDNDDVDMQGDEPRERNRNIPLAYQYRIPRAERLVDPNAPNEPT